MSKDLTNSPVDRQNIPSKLYTLLPAVLDEGSRI